MLFGIYDPKDWIVELDGITITAIGEGGVTWEKAESNGEAKWGIGGDAIWQKGTNGGYTLTISVMRHCPQKSQNISKFKRSVPFPVNTSHKDLKERFGGTKAVFEEEPSFEGGTEAGDLELKLYVFDGKTETI